MSHSLPSATSSRPAVLNGACLLMWFTIAHLIIPQL